MTLGRILWAIPMFGANTKQGLVELRLEDKVVQLHVDEARDFAFSILEAAEAAETDEFLMSFLETKIGMGDLAIRCGVLKDFRNWRDSKRREKTKGENKNESH